MAALICGSLAFDTITNFPGRFAQQILPEQVHILNVSFLVPTLRKEYGGCAGNIGYTLRALGGDAVVMAAVGSDGKDYVERLQGLGIDVSCIHTDAGSYTAQGMCITDQDNNQIWAFHPGAMSLAHLTEVPARSDLKIGIIAPDGRDAMLVHAQQMHAAGIPFVFDPGQGLPMFDGAELRRFVEQATWVTVNDYEARMLCERMGTDIEALSRSHLKGLVVTLADQGCEVWQQGQRTLVPGVKASDVLDPTGCGDAFRGGLLYGLERGWELSRCAALGNRLGALKIASRGGQNHQVDPAILEG
ncbi:carbohydrate kinase family protein [Aquincola sp. J276]|uniref:carbohydrate kinase family protein n=1 Tax=Aquincola sp. J276 TaxID=2898432 RepID=UPI002151F675|nr:carbohydrate kinase family protein [Aquincola sp. J276]MCR5866874.1 carbohydrate kinase family protein [Aquincola sp. J276]